MPLQEWGNSREQGDTATINACKTHATRCLCKSGETRGNKVTLRRSMLAKHMQHCPMISASRADLHTHCQSSNLGTGAVLEQKHFTTSSSSISYFRRGNGSLHV